MAAELAHTLESLVLQGLEMVRSSFRQASSVQARRTSPDWVGSKVADEL